MLNLARLYAESGDMQHAAKSIEAVPVDGRTPKMEFTLGALYDQMKQPKDAIAAYKRADDMEPGDLQTVDALAQALLNNDQLDDALKQYKELAEANPDDAEPLIHIAEIERRQGKYEDALTVVRKARKMDPNSLEAGFNEGLLLDILDRLDEAIQTYQEMVDSPQVSHANGAYTEEEKNNRSIFLERLGTVCLEENKLDQAIAAYQKMIDLGGSIAVRGYQGEIDAYRGAHEFDKALDVAQKAVAADPKDSDLKLMLAGETRRPGPSRRWTGDGEGSARWRHARRTARHLVRDRADERAPAPLEGCRRRVRQGRAAGDQEGRPHVFVLPARRAGRTAKAFRPGRTVFQPGARSRSRERHDAELSRATCGPTRAKSCRKR